MNHTDYLLHLDRKGVEMGVNDDGALRAGPPTKLTPEDRTYIIANKTSLLADMEQGNHLDHRLRARRGCVCRPGANDPMFLGR